MRLLAFSVQLCICQHCCLMLTWDFYMPCHGSGGQSPDLPRRPGVRHRPGLVWFVVARAKTGYFISSSTRCSYEKNRRAKQHSAGWDSPSFSVRIKKPKISLASGVACAHVDRFVPQSTVQVTGLSCNVVVVGCHLNILAGRQVTGTWRLVNKSTENMAWTVFMWWAVQFTA